MAAPILAHLIGCVVAAGVGALTAMLEG